MILRVWSDGRFELPAPEGGAARLVRCALGPTGVIEASAKRSYSVITA